MKVHKSGGRRLTKRLFEPHDRALVRVGTRPSARLTWLLTFAQGEPGKLPAVAFQELVDEMQVFSTDAGYRWPADEPWAPSRDVVDALARKVREGVEALFGRVEGVSHGGGNKIIHPRSFAITHEDLGDFTEGITGRPGESRLIPFYIGAPAGAFLRAAFDLVKNHGHRIRECRYRECGRLFSASKGQAYDSPLCSQRERTAKWAEKRGPERLYELRHRRYEQTVKKQTGKNIKVQRLGRRKGEKNHG